MTAHIDSSITTKTLLRAVTRTNASDEGLCNVPLHWLAPAFPPAQLKPKRRLQALLSANSNTASNALLQCDSWFLGGTRYSPIRHDGETEMGFWFKAMSFLARSLCSMLSLSENDGHPNLWPSWSSKKDIRMAVAHEQVGLLLLWIHRLHTFLSRLPKSVQ